MPAQPKPILLTLVIDECEHSGDSEAVTDALRDAGCRFSIDRTVQCENAEMAFIEVTLVGSLEAFKEAARKAADGADCAIVEGHRADLAGIADDDADYLYGD